MDPSLRRGLAAVEDRHWWYEGRRAVVAHVLEHLDLPANARLLDAGCGGGSSLEMLARFGRVSAFEPDRRDRERAARRRIGVVVDGSLPDRVPFLDIAFDAALALDVIEHLDDDEGALRALGPRLVPGGILVVTVPAHPFLWSRHDELNGHRRRYTASGLRRVVGLAGFEVLRVTHFNALLMPLALLARRAGRIVGMDAAGTALLPDPVNRILARTFAAERHLLPAPGFPFGVSLLAVARRA